MQTLPSLPSELFEEILHFAIDIHPTRHAISRVNSTWANVSLPILHSRITFNSTQQLRLFSATPGDLRCSPKGREVEVHLGGGAEGIGVWPLIYSALTKCQRSTSSPSKLCHRGVRVLRLCMNSHLSDYDVQLIGKALCQVNPEVFVWNGPDPDHHFSTAVYGYLTNSGFVTQFLLLSQIVPTAVKQLCEAVPNWSSLRRLELSNVAFHNNGLELSRALTKLCNCSFPFNPPYTDGVGPIRIVISQAVFMLPTSVLNITMGVPALKELRLIDVYQHSIWGPRMRIGDVEGSLMTSEYSTHPSADDCLKRLREVVSCVAKTERLMGGDRELREH